MSLRLGLNTGYWAAAAPPPSALESVQEAERLGFDSVWTSEAYGCDVLTPLHEGATGLGKPLKSTLRPLRDGLPVYLAAEGPMVLG